MLSAEDGFQLVVPGNMWLLACLPPKDCTELRVVWSLPTWRMGTLSAIRHRGGFGYLANFKQITHIAPYL